ncbi:hypothetical protein C7S13_3835 [Burkholderia cepacia]|nr:hypothetical protein [Burkholderia cepacia]
MNAGGSLRVATRAARDRGHSLHAFSARQTTYFRAGHEKNARYSANRPESAVRQGCCGGGGMERGRRPVVFSTGQRADRCGSR